LAVLTSCFGAHLSKPVIPNPRAHLKRFVVG